MNADRSSGERIRRLKALAAANGPAAKSRDYDALQTVKFGKSPYVRLSATGTIIEENCCSSACNLTALNTWNPSTGVPVGFTSNDIAYANGLWVAVGFDGFDNDIIYSTDPQNGWTYSPGKTFSGVGYSVEGGAGITYGNGLWVAVGYDGSGNNILYTTDPSKGWTPSPGTPFNISGFGSDVVYGNGLWVAVGQDLSDNNILYSTDPTKGWTPSLGEPFVGICSSISYRDGLWVAVGLDASGNAIQYTTDPKKGWTPSPGYTFGPGNPGGGGSGNGITYGNGLWVAVGYAEIGFKSTGKNILYTTDPKKGWTPSPGTPFNVNGAGNGIAYANGLWVAVGYDASGNTILYTTDPSKGWTPSMGETFLFSSGIAYANALWVAVGYDARGNTIQYSTAAC